MKPPGTIGWNLFANLFGQVWRALMALAFVPFYVKILGVEAFGLIGLYASLQLALGLLDAGLRPTLAREMARFTGGAMDAHAIRTLLRSVEWLLFGLAALILAIMLVAAPGLALHGVKLEQLDLATVISAFQAMGLVAAAQFIESAYNSSLSGLQRQVVLNMIGVLTSTLRGFGTLVVLWFYPSLTAFFLWQSAVAALSVLLLALAVYRHLPPVQQPVRFSWPALQKVRGYAQGMLGIAILSLLLTQADRLLLAKLLPLSELGRYSLAASLAGALSLISTPIANTFYPRLTQIREQDGDAALGPSLHRATRLIAVLVGSGAAVLVAFGEVALGLWLHDRTLAAEVAPVLDLLAMSVLFNALTTMPYMLQLANGETGITLRINSVSLLVYAPLMIWAVTQWGKIGAAGCAMILNISGLLLCGWFSLRRFAPMEMRRWWLRSIALPLLTVFCAALALGLMVPAPGSLVAELALLLFSGLIVLGAGVLSDPLLRNDLRRVVSNYR